MADQKNETEEQARQRLAREGRLLAMTRGSSILYFNPDDDLWVLVKAGSVVRSSNFNALHQVLIAPR